MSVFSLSLVGAATRVALIAVTLAISVLVARALGPAGLGQFFLFVQLVAILAVVADAGVSQGVAANFGRDPQANRYRYAVVLRVLPASVTVTAAIAGGVLALGHERLLPRFPVRLLWLVFAALPCLVYSNVWTNMMAGMGRIREASAAQLAGSVLWLLLTAVFVGGMGGGLLAAALGYCVALLGQSALMALVAVRVLGRRCQNDALAGTGRELVLFAARAFPGAIAYLLMIRLPAFLLNGFHGPAAVGIFSAAQQISERTLIPIVAVQAATYRAMADATRDAATAAVNRYVRLCTAAMAVCLVIGVALAGPIVRVLLGEQYSAAVAICRILLPGVLFLTWTLLLDAFFLNQLRRPGTLSILAGGEVVLVLVLGLLLIPRWGATGAAVTLTLTQLVGSLVYVRWHLAATGTSIRELLVVDRHDVRDVLRRSTAGLARRRRQ